MSADNGTYIFCCKDNRKSNSTLFIVKRGNAIQNILGSPRKMYEFFRTGQVVKDVEDALYLAEICELEETGPTEYGIEFVGILKPVPYWSELVEKYA